VEELTIVERPAERDDTVSILRHDDSNKPPFVEKKKSGFEPVGPDLEEIPAPSADSLTNSFMGTPAESPRFRLTARFVGDDDPEAYEFYGDVKAVTYNEMKIESCPGGPWVIQVVVDM
jgi:hypothetical protein